MSSNSVKPLDLQSWPTWYLDILSRVCDKAKCKDTLCPCNFILWLLHTEYTVYCASHPQLVVLYYTLSINLGILWRLLKALTPNFLITPLSVSRLYNLCCLNQSMWSVHPLKWTFLCLKTIIFSLIAQLPYLTYRTVKVTMQTPCM